MNTGIMQHPAPAVKTARFVTPFSEYDQGKALYKARKALSECVTDDMAAGWIDAADLAATLTTLRQMEAEGMPCPADMF